MNLLRLGGGLARKLAFRFRRAGVSLLRLLLVATSLETVFFG